MKNQLFAVVALSAVIFLTSSNLVAGQITKSGKCPHVEVEPDFRLKDYFGKWWIQEKYPSYTIKGGRCLLANHEKIDANTFWSRITQLDNNGTLHTNELTAKVVGNAHFLEHFNNDPSKQYNYYILETDYFSYIVVFRCEEVGDQHKQYLWIQTRDQNPVYEIIEKGRKAIAKRGLSTNDLKPVNNTNCY